MISYIEVYKIGAAEGYEQSKIYCSLHFWRKKQKRLFFNIILLNFEKQKIIQ